jgi:deoxyribonuclease-4
MSIAGGLDRAFERGKATGCQVIQIFTRNANQWQCRPLSVPEIHAFHKARQKSGIHPVAVHDSYLINLASPRAELRERSLNALLVEISRAEILEIPYVVMHPGFHLGAGEAVGLQRIADALNRIHDLTPDCRAKLVLETTAGQGTSLGYRFEHLADILDRSEASERLRICVDTCHLFAAGYDFRTAETYRNLIERFSALIGLDYLAMIHVNDAKKGLGSKVDRHEHLGQGFIGETAFSLFLTDPVFRNLPFLIETPKGRDEEGNDWDVRNLTFLRQLMEKGKPDDRV